MTVSRMAIPGRAALAAFGVPPSWRQRLPPVCVPRLPVRPGYASRHPCHSTALRTLNPAKNTRSDHSDTFSSISHFLAPGCDRGCSLFCTFLRGLIFQSNDEFSRCTKRINPKTVLVHGGLGNLRFAALAFSASWRERSTASSLATVSPFTNNGGFSWPKIVYHVLEG